MNLSKFEIAEGNKLIGDYMGIESFTHEGIQWTGDLGNENLETMKYHMSWDWLFDVIDKINGLGKEYSFATFKTYVALSVEKGGKVYKDFVFAHSEYITAEQTGREAAFKLIVKYIKWQNEINAEKDLEVTK